MISCHVYFITSNINSIRFSYFNPNNAIEALPQFPSLERTLSLSLQLDFLDPTNVLTVEHWAHSQAVFIGCFFFISLHFFSLHSHSLHFFPSSSCCLFTWLQMNARFVVCRNRKSIFMFSNKIFCVYKPLCTKCTFYVLLCVLHM